MVVDVPICICTASQCACCAGCYFAAESKFKLEHYLINYGLLTGLLQSLLQFNRTMKILSASMRYKSGFCCAENDLRADANPEERSWLAKAVTSSGSSFAVAFLCTKALLPVRVPLTIGITPVIARYVHAQKEEACSALMSCRLQLRGPDTRQVI